VVVKWSVGGAYNTIAKAAGKENKAKQKQATETCVAHDQRDKTCVFFAVCCDCDLRRATQDVQIACAVVCTQITNTTYYQHAWYCTHYDCQRKSTAFEDAQAA
jgi:hypothetical protein